MGLHTTCLIKIFPKIKSLCPTFPRIIVDSWFNLISPGYLSFQITFKHTGEKLNEKLYCIHNASPWEKKKPTVNTKDNTSISRSRDCAEPRQKKVPQGERASMGWVRGHQAALCFTFPFGVIRLWVIQRKLSLFQAASNIIKHHSPFIFPLNNGKMQVMTNGSNAISIWQNNSKTTMREIWNLKIYFQS